MSWALGVAKGAKGVEVKSGGYSTQPVHDKSGKIGRWTASQDLVLEAADADAVSALIGKLQSKLQLRSIAFSVSPDTRRKVEDALIGDVLGAFQERAKRVQSGLGARDWELVAILDPDAVGRTSADADVRARQDGDGRGGRAELRERTEHADGARRRDDRAGSGEALGLCSTAGLRDGLVGLSAGNGSLKPLSRTLRFLLR
jgi:predicted secreted protein